MTDQDLLRAYVEAQDADSFGTFVCRYQDSVLRFVTHFLGDREAAQDVAQETFLQAARHPRRLLGVVSCHNWLLRVARNLGVDHLRRAARRRRHVAAVGELRARAGLTAEPTQVAALERAELRDRVHAEIAQLSPRHRELLLLRVQEQKSYQEIAEITGLTATNVGFILHQAMKCLAGRLSDVGEG